jgi:hypothetical protein
LYSASDIVTTRSISFIFYIRLQIYNYFSNFQRFFNKAMIFCLKGVGQLVKMAVEKGRADCTACGSAGGGGMMQ